MIKTFDQSVFGKEASRLLASIQQGRRSVADYSVEFRTLAATSGWNAEALVARFLEGLNDAFKDELYAREVPDRLDDLISLALRLDARRELRRRARMRTEPVASTPLAPSSDESEPMQVDRLRLTAKEKQRRLLEGLCLYCAAQGHHAQSCPVKQSRPPQRGSALIDSGAEGNFIDEEWARARGILLQPLSSPIIAHGLDGRPLMRLSQITDSEEEMDLSRVPSCYHDLWAVFSRSRAVSLPPHRPYDCAIDLLPEGLNDAFKDELYAREVPDRLDDLISLALRLDARRELRRCARMRTEPVASTPLAPSSDESEPPPDTVIPSGCGVGALTWGIEERVKRGQRGVEVPTGCPASQSAPPFSSGVTHPESCAIQA
ncbi:Retrotransposon-derived PEG10 [Labeo rohita]|uniref:Retrotransposon-derived PEG10 n=1 Tax=Labeo rohita TaxID=84645 RepID=A0A498P231_LABRO|nr:Retrotransposon-derived PEG10 [Labeo rohita]